MLVLAIDIILVLVVVLVLAVSVERIVVPLHFFIRVVVLVTWLAHFVSDGDAIFSHRSKTPGALIATLRLILVSVVVASIANLVILEVIGLLQCVVDETCGPWLRLVLFLLEVQKEVYVC